MVKNFVLLGVQINKKIKTPLNKWTKEIISTLFTQARYIHCLHFKTLEDVTEN